MKETTAWVVVVCVAAALGLVLGLVGMDEAHETKVKRLEIVKVCVQQHQPPEICRRLGSA